MLRLPRRIRDDMVSHAFRGFPREVCGILGGKGVLVTESHRIRNLKASPEHFLMDPLQQMAVMESLRERGLEPLAFYHSHPRGPAVPSAEDVRLAFYPEVATVIISLADAAGPEVRAFRIVGGESMEVDLDAEP